MAHLSGKRNERGGSGTDQPGAIKGGVRMAAARGPPCMAARCGHGHPRPPLPTPIPHQPPDSTTRRSSRQRRRRGGGRGMPKFLVPPTPRPVVVECERRWKGGKGGEESRDSIVSYGGVTGVATTSRGYTNADARVAAAAAPAAVPPPPPPSSKCRGGWGQARRSAGVRGEGEAHGRRGEGRSRAAVAVSPRAVARCIR